MATLLLPGGTSEEVKPKRKVEFTLKEMQAFVGGYIDIVPLADGRLLILNEEGKLNGLLPNEEATRLYWQNRDTVDIIVGPVLVCTKKEAM